MFSNSSPDLDTKDAVTTHQVSIDQYSELKRLLRDFYKMSSADRNICFVLLFCAITIAAESNTTSVKHNEQESSISDAIKSLEATLERKCDQLIAAVNATPPGKSIVKSGN